MPRSVTSEKSTPETLVRNGHHVATERLPPTYLAKPLSAAMVRDAAAAVTNDAPEHRCAGDVIALAGSPGIGVYTLVAAVARAVAAEGRTARIVDLDPVSGKLSTLLGVEPRDGLHSLLVSIGSGDSDGAELSVPQDGIEEVSTPVASSISLIAYSPSGRLPERRGASALFLGRETREREVPGFAGFVDGGDDAPAGAGKRPGTLHHPFQHGIEVQACIDPERRR